MYRILDRRGWDEAKWNSLPEMEQWRLFGYDEFLQRQLKEITDVLMYDPKASVDDLDGAKVIDGTAKALIILIQAGLLR